MTQVGTLFLEIIAAKLDISTDTWGKMDPFCIISTQGSTVKTKTHFKADKNPVWNEKFPIKVIDIKGDIKIEVQEEDTMSNDFVGDTTFKIEKLCA